MYDYENKNTDIQQDGAAGTGSAANNGEYRYTGPFYQDNYANSYSSANTGTGSSYYSNSSAGEVQKPKKKKKWAGLIAKTVCVALVFGVVASAAFQATNYLGKKVWGDDVTVENTGGTTTLLPKVDSTQTVSNSGETDLSSVATIAENCMPSLVAITNVSVVEVPNYYSWGFFWGGGGTQQQEQTSSGTGIIIGMNETELLIVTNNHVIEGATTLTVVFSMDEGNEEAEAVEAKIKGTDESKDLGVIAVKLEDIPQETLSSIKVATIGDSSSLRVGEQVVAIGNALGYGQSVTTGIISALGRDIALTNEDGSPITNSLIQTDAAINPGNSGGALLNMKGEVIGINEAKYSQTGVEGMGYAIPISDVESIISDLSLRTTRDKVDDEDRGYLGITCQDVTAEVSQQFDMPQGIYVKSVTKGSAADAAGIKKGDVITKFDRVSVSAYEDLVEQLGYYEAGETVEIVLQSPVGAEYEEKTVQVTLTSASRAGIK
ncbi:MAG: trypsin-like peptidase domain-containing protein [Lachnospiraceae bacterium]|nr:trypsin-like peptidase domain-containing protein [Lachnospiraceae bacterium]